MSPTTTMMKVQYQKKHNQIQNGAFEAAQYDWVRKEKRNRNKN